MRDFPFQQNIITFHLDLRQSVQPMSLLSVPFISSDDGIRRNNDAEDGNLNDLDYGLESFVVVSSGEKLLSPPRCLIGPVNGFYQRRTSYLKT